MENKYYQPDITELYIGYKCEIYEQTSTKLVKKIDWHVIKVVTGNSKYGETVSVNKLPKYIKDSKIRTKYLDSYDITSLGFENLSDGVRENAGIFYFKKDTLYLTYNRNTLELTLDNDGDYDNYNCYFDGKCKSINEFKKILEWIK